MNPRFSARAALLSGLCLAAAAAQAHTGHGHQAFDPVHGLLHALTEPDHLALLGAGAALCTWLAPRVLRLARRVHQAHQARRARLAAPAAPLAGR